jgi:hypothetical protein
LYPYEPVYPAVVEAVIVLIAVVVAVVVAAAAAAAAETIKTLSTKSCPDDTSKIWVDMRGRTSQSCAHWTLSIKRPVVGKQTMHLKLRDVHPETLSLSY